MGKYIKLFKTHAEYTAFINSQDFIRPNVSHCIDANDAHYNPLVINPKDTVGSVAYFDGTEVKFALKNNFTPSMGTPIGVVVIPQSHMQDGKCRVMSLANMSYLTPETGTLVGTSNDDAQDAGANLMWGVYGTDISELTNYDKVVTIDGQTSSASGYLPSDYWVGKTEEVIPDDDTYEVTPITNTIDTETAWGEMVDYTGELTDDICIPSPYALDGGKNPLYFTSGQAMCDMDGASNTAVLVSKSAISSQTSGSFENIQANYPAAMACHMYHTVGTSQGDWYLPAMGELGYLYVRAKKINETLTALGENAVNYGLPSTWDKFGSWLWSSSEYSSNVSRGLNYGGSVGNGSKYSIGNYGRVRALSAF